jgi:lipopolysaccharide transport system ATP-binding protein
MWHRGTEMSDIAIRAENLSKRYRIGLVEEKQDTLSGAVVDALLRPLQNLRDLRRLAMFSSGGTEREDIIWALRDVSFEVRKGEVVGIIGRNGAGKTTLLKILSRITEPTEGQAVVRGRVRSLLEVGTGFHVELTGRENIYMNGTVLGMRKTEIDGKFDEIVDFSGVEKFIDTPVKRYSTGMKVRLAFAVAAHLEPEVLLVDEVLAVGDAEFQKKCLGKMQSVTEEGRTVLFVSHNMQALQNLCPEAILLVNGQLKMFGKSPEVVEAYLQEGIQREGEYIWDMEEAQDEHKIFAPISLRVLDHEGQICENLSTLYPITIEFTYSLLRKVSNLRVGIILKTISGESVCSSFDKDNPNQKNDYTRTPGVYSARCIIPGNLLNDHTYTIGVVSSIRGMKRLYWDPQVISFTLNAMDGIGAHWNDLKRRGGVLRPNFKWTTKLIE